MQKTAYEMGHGIPCETLLRSTQSATGSSVKVRQNHESIVNVVFFFFSSRRRHTRFDCDWSSDVCSSDLSSSPSLGRAALIAEHGNKQVGDARRSHVAKRGELLAFDTIEQQDAAPEHLEIGRASCRERV